MAKPTTKQKPAHEIRLGRIKATIWENETDSGTRHNVVVSRIYRDGDEWKQTSSFGRDDLPVVAKVVDLAHTWIYEQAGQKELAGCGLSGDWPLLPISCPRLQRPTSVSGRADNGYQGSGC